MWYDIEANRVDPIAVVEAREQTAQGALRAKKALSPIKKGRPHFSSKKIERVRRSIFSLDMHPKEAENRPEYFRTTGNSSKVVRSSHDAKIFKRLHISGSGQFSERGLEKIFKRVQKDFPSKDTQFFVIDTRQESHFYLNGLPVSLRGGKNNSANTGKSLSQIQREEEKFASIASTGPKLTIKGSGTKKKKIRPKKAVTEEELVRAFKANYVRIPITDRCLPDKATVDQFVKFVQTLPKNSWLHFHCRRGVGRTTLFMAMFQIIKQAKTLSLKEMAAFQKSIGGMLVVKKEKSGLSESARKRNRFFQNFYEYCKQNKDNYQTEWSKWCLKKQKSTASSKK